MSRAKEEWKVAGSMPVQSKSLMEAILDYLANPDGPGDDLDDIVITVDLTELEKEAYWKEAAEEWRDPDKTPVSSYGLERLLRRKSARLGGGG